jgi:V/A-type H+-transporting ATPase subunit I
MFYPARMERVAVGFHNAYSVEVIQTLHESGAMEIIPIRDESNSVRGKLDPYGRSPVLDTTSGLILNLDRILEVFARIPRKEVNPVSAFLSPPLITPGTVHQRPAEEIFTEVELLLTRLKRVGDISNLLIESEEELDHVEKELLSIGMLKPFGFDLSYIGESEYLFISAGKVDPRKYQEFRGDLQNTLFEDLFLFEKDEKTHVLIVVAVPISEKPKIERFLRPPRYQPVHPGSRGSPEEALFHQNEKKLELNEKRGELFDELKGLERMYVPDLHRLREELVLLKEELEALAGCGASREVTVVDGWVQAGDVPAVEKRLDQSAEGHIFFTTRVPGEQDPEPPVAYQNPRWLQPFEVLTSTFARPHYDEIDPTPFIAPAFVLFFGLMLGDAGYGLILTAAGLFLYYKVGRSSRSLHDLTYILLIISIAATILGILQGGWFGDIPQRFFGTTPPFVIIEPLEDPIAFFQLSLLIGIVHINLGLCLALYQNLKKGAFRSAFYEQGVWFILQPAAGVLLAGFFGWVVFPPLIVYASYAGILTGLVMIFYYRGPMGFFGLTGFLGDWLSYVRILALALATGGIAMTINILTEIIAGISPFMIVPAAIIFLGGHIFNIAIQSLGGVIHAIRLQYIEFFGKFYTGGGQEFTPFRTDRVYTRLEERDSG